MLKPYLALSRTVHILCVGALINRAGTFLVPFLTIYLEKKLNLGIGFATWTMGAFGLGALVASIVGGHLADRIGRRTVMVISLLGAAAILLVFGSLTSRWTIMPAVLVFALVSEMYRPAAMAMVADVTPPHLRAHAFGLMYVAINLGFALAAAIGGYMASYSFQWLFWGDALTATIYAVLILLMIRETLPAATRKDLSSSAGSPAGDSEGDHGSSDSLRRAARHMLRDRVFVMYWLGSLCLAGTYMQAMSTFPLHLGALGIGPGTYGPLIALNGLMIVFLQLPVTSLVTRYHRGNMVVVSALVTALGIGLIGVAGSVPAFAFTIVIWTCGEMMNSPLMAAIISDLAPAHMRARYMGAYSMSFSAALMIGAPLGGFVLVHFGSSWLWGGSALIGILAAVVYAAVRKHTKVRTTEHLSDG